MLMKIHRAWRSFRALPEIIQFGAAVALGIIAMVVWPKDARADAIAREENGSWVRMTAQPCKDAKILSYIAARGGDASQFRAATAEFNAKPYLACWRADFRARVTWVIFDDGDFDSWKFRELRHAPEA